MGDLDKIRAAVKPWTPAIAAAVVGSVGGASLTVFILRAVAGFASDKGGTVMAVAALLALAATNAAVWRMWGQAKAEKTRRAWQSADKSSAVAAQQRAHIADLEQANKRLKDENEQLRRAEVAHLPHKQAGAES